MKLENFDKHAKVIKPWLDIKESDETLDTKQKRQVQMISMTLEFAEAITGDEKTDKSERGKYWNTLQMEGSRFDDWPVITISTGVNLDETQKLWKANEEKEALVIIETFSDEQLTLLRRIVTPSVRMGTWFDLDKMKSEIGNAHSRTILQALKDKRVADLAISEGLSEVAMPPKKPKIVREKKDDKAPAKSD